MGCRYRVRDALLVCVGAMTSLLVSSPASADIFDSDDGLMVNDGFDLTAGTVRYDAVVQASRTNQQLYGVIGTFERFILPKIQLAKADDHDGMAVEYHIVYNVAEAFGRCGSLSNDCPEGPTINQVDLYAGNLAFTYSLGE